MTILTVGVPSPIIQMSNISIEFIKCRSPKGFIFSLQQHVVKFGSYYLHATDNEAESLKVEMTFPRSH